MNKPPTERFAFPWARVARRIKKDKHFFAKQKCLSFYYSSLLIRADYATAFLANSAKAAKPAASLTAISANILRLISTPATFKPCIIWL